ncbi:MAG: endopeptidase La [Armatimonadota bacterium]|nr:endopeptidase La [Armatimonadota bacterium]
MPRARKGTSEGDESTSRPRPTRRRRTAPAEAEQEQGGSLEAQIPSQLPLVPIRDQVYFPQMVFPLFVGRERSVRALEEAMDGDRLIALAAQKEVIIEEPEPEDIYDVGIVAEVLQVLRMPDGTLRLMLQGIERIRVTRYIQTEPFILIEVQPIPSQKQRDLEIEALMGIVVSLFEQLVNAGKNIPPEVLLSVSNQSDPERIINTVTPYLPVRVEEKQQILAMESVRERLERLAVLMRKEIEILELQKTIRSRVEKEMGDTQREFFLREQLKVIQQELGERDERTSEIEEFRQKILAAGMPEEVQLRAFKELERLEKMPFAAPEGVVVRNYLDWLVSLPWSNLTEDNLDITAAAQVLDEDHYGLHKVKERILEFLAVRKLAGSAMKGPILCFVGPPGVGKTSIGRSIARALGRKFVRISLGGVRDEAEIRGHRRTYVGALPGRIIQGIRQAGSRNPVFMLDEIDKLGMDFRGDPSAALLEALDPEQNYAFSDHYLEVPFNLREVMFITTANLLDPIPPALRDRMEVITFPGYTEDEKMHIARGFLVPKQLKEHGLTPEQCQFTDAAIQLILREYTREAGVRNLEREIASVCRKVARAIAEGQLESKQVLPEDIPVYLGTRKYHYGTAEEKDEVGAATGLVVTQYGGDIVSIEVSVLPATKGQLLLTGQLGEVMKESAQAALTYIRSRASQLQIDPEFTRNADIHIHVPEGAVPKDGPSAGITIATALASAFTGRPVRRDVAMTGEITLRGRILPIGGVKEKVLAAHRAGIRVVVLPEENRRDMDEIPQQVLQEIEFRFVRHMDEVLQIALLGTQ